MNGEIIQGITDLLAKYAALQQHADEMEKAAKGVTEHEEGAITKLITALHNYEQFKSK